MAAIILKERSLFVRKRAIFQATKKHVRTKKVPRIGESNISQIPKKSNSKNIGAITSNHTVCSVHFKLGCGPIMADPVPTVHESSHPH